MRQLKWIIGLILVVVAGGVYFLNLGSPLQDVMMANSQFDNEFKNTALGIEFTVPQGWKIDKESYEVDKENELIYLVEAVNEIKGGRLCIFANKLNVLNAFWSSKMWADQLKDDLFDGDDFAQYQLKLKQDTSDITFGDKKGSKLTYAGHVEDVPMEISVYCFKVRGYVVCVETVTVSADNQEIDQVARTVKLKY